MVATIIISIEAVALVALSVKLLKVRFALQDKINETSIRVEALEKRIQNERAEAFKNLALANA